MHSSCSPRRADSNASNRTEIVILITEICSPEFVMHYAARSMETTAFGGLSWKMPSSSKYWHNVVMKSVRISLIYVNWRSLTKTDFFVLLFPSSDSVFSRVNVQFALRYQLWAFGDPLVFKTDWTFLQDWPNMPLLGNQCRSFPDGSCTHRQTCSQTWPNVKNSEHLTAQQCLWRHNSNGLHRRVTKLGSLFVCMITFRMMKFVAIYLVKCMRERFAKME